jgi:hypothetical protein
VSHAHLVSMSPAVFILGEVSTRVRAVEYLRKDITRPLVLSANNDGLLMWYVDASFVVHPSMCEHTGGGLTLGRGFPISTSTKRKSNTRSSTECELVGVDDMMPIILWTDTSFCHKAMESLNISCYKTTRVQFSLSRMEGPHAANVRGTSTFSTFLCVIEST